MSSSSVSRVLSNGEYVSIVLYDMDGSLRAVGTILGSYPGGRWRVRVLNASDFGEEIFLETYWKTVMNTHLRPVGLRSLNLISTFVDGESGEAL